jgi:hypothetical protein
MSKTWFKVGRENKELKGENWYFHKGRVKDPLRFEAVYFCGASFWEGGCAIMKPTGGEWFGPIKFPV